MDNIDVDEIAEINFPDRKPDLAEVRFKDGSTKTYNTIEHPEVLATLNHWTPPMA